MFGDVNRLANNAYAVQHPGQPCPQTINSTEIHELLQPAAKRMDSSHNETLARSFPTSCHRPTEMIGSSECGHTARRCFTRHRLATAVEAFPYSGRNVDRGVQPGEEGRKSRRRDSHSNVHSDRGTVLNSIRFHSGNRFSSTIRVILEISPGKLPMCPFIEESNTPSTIT